MRTYSYDEICEYFLIRESNAFQMMCECVFAIILCVRNFYFVRAYANEHQRSNEGK